MIFPHSAAQTHPGRKRPNNEDYITFFEPVDEKELRLSGCIYILADGVGGASLGEHASQFAAQKILYEYYQHPDISPAQRLKKIIRQAGNEIFDFAEGQDHFMRMATTIVVAVIRNEKLQIAHVGDSRAYLIRDGNVIQLTRDHSTVGELVRDGLLSEEESMHFNGRNLLSRSLGGQPDVQVDVTEEIWLSPGDKILLTSDGFSRYATREQINKLLTDESPDVVVNKLIDFANEKGGLDNISIILVNAIQKDDIGKTIPTGQKPVPVNWDSFPTEPSVYDYTGSKKGFLKIPSLFIVIPALILIMIIGFIYTKIARNEDPLSENADIYTSSPLVNVTNTNYPTQSVTRTLVRRTLNVATFEGIEVSEILQTPIATEEYSFTNTPEISTAYCRYTIKDTDLITKEGKETHSLDKILNERFDLEYGHPLGYESFQAYTRNINPVEGYDNSVNKYYYVNLGYIIDLPGIPRETCLNAGGEYRD
jgi:protein phosphatase